MIGDHAIRTRPNALGGLRGHARHHLVTRELAIGIGIGLAEPRGHVAARHAVHPVSHAARSHATRSHAAILALALHLRARLAQPAQRNCQCQPCH